VNKEPRHRINRQIKAQSVRLIGDSGEQLGILSLTEALRLASDQSLDLVEISPNAEPPVVKLTDYGKFLYQESKQRTVAKQKQKRIKVKEVKFRPGTGKADYEVKLRNLRGFLEDGDKARVVVVFRGREMAHVDLGMVLMARIRADLEEFAKVDFYPSRVEGRQLVMVLSPKKK
jgi:translation initiation factor IF-3